MRGFRYILAWLLLVSAMVVNAQDIKVLHHTYYTSWFSTSKHIPVAICYRLRSGMIECGEHVTRSYGHFMPDPEAYDYTDLSYDYRGSGYDRGHNMSAADNGCDLQGMRECFYFSNMTPQPHYINAGSWELLEKHEREEAHAYGDLYICVGSVGQITTIGPDSVVVPRYMFKTIYFPGSKCYECYLYDMEDAHSENLADYTCGLGEIEKLSGIHIVQGVAQVPGATEK